MLSMSNILTIGFGIAVSIAASSIASADSDLAKEAEQAGVKIDLADEHNIAAGDTLFNKSCTLYCHGKDGTKNRAPSLRNRDDLTVRDLQYVISKGRKRAGKVMPAWRTRLKDEEIWQLVAYLVSLRDAGPVEK